MGARVLIIEDNHTNLELMTYLLQAFGHTVLAAETGHAGLEAAGRDHPDLIICDIHLPDIDGIEIARRLHHHPALHSIPLLAVTALAMVGDRDRLLAAGFDGYFAKPIDPETFVEKMEEFLPLQQRTFAARSPGAPVPPDPQAPPPCYTILAVDNLPVNLELARSILVPSGYKVITAGSMAEGLDLARANVCHLILSDVWMGASSGYDFLLAVLADPQLQAIPFILISSTLMGDRDRDRGLALGVSRFLRRPIEPGILLAEIRACLGEGGMN